MLFIHKGVSLKTVFLLALFATTSKTSFAQTVMRDVLYLKNGSIIRGIIFEQTPPDQLKIKTSDSSIFVHKYEEVLKIEREPMPVTNNYAGVIRLPPLVPEDYGGKMGIGVLVGGAGGALGIPIRYNINRKIALEVSVNARPYLYSPIYMDSFYDGYNQMWYYYVNDKSDNEFRVVPAIMGGIDWFADEHHGIRKDKIIKNGLLLRGGATFNKVSTEKFLVLGWAHETFKRDYKNRSYLFEMGLGILHANPPYVLNGPDINFEMIPFLYWKIHWNWFLF